MSKETGGPILGKNLTLKAGLGSCLPSWGWVGGSSQRMPAGGDIGADFLERLTLSGNVTGA